MSYGDRAERERLRQREASEHARDIGPLPDIADPKRLNACQADLERGLRTYFPARFPLPFSPNHQRVIGAIQEAATKGLLQAIAMPRGSGKTTICECAAILVVLFAWHHYVAILGATQKDGRKRLDSVKKELRFNQLLLADFPAACYPIHRLHGITQRARGQTCGGEPTEIYWEKDRIVLPTIAGSSCSSAVIECGGILSAVRGLNFTTPAGEVRRPSFALVDDFQTRRSAKSIIQCEEREAIINGDLMYLAGPSKKIAAVLPITVIRKDDAADRILDRKLNPEFRGIRTQMLDKFPDDLDLWDQYGEKRAEELANDGDGSKATAWYKRRRKKMDAGAVVTWDKRFDRGAGEVSAIQHAMNRYYSDPVAFWAECQNDPGMAFTESADDFLGQREIAAKVSGYPRHAYGDECTATTCYVDVQKELLYYVVVAWAEGFTGYVADYGTWPRQKTQYFALSQVRRTLSKEYPGRQLDGRIFQGLTDLTSELAEVYKISQGLIDAQWGEQRDNVYSWCAQSQQRYWPAHGKFIGPAHRPMRHWGKSPGELPLTAQRAISQMAAHWRSPKPAAGQVRHVTIDTNWCKTFLHRRLLVPMGDRGALSLFSPRGGENHRMIADHVTAEKRVPTEGPFGQVDVYQQLPDRPDNHLFDCLVGNCVAASIAGICESSRTAAKGRATRRRPNVSF